MLDLIFRLVYTGWISFPILWLNSSSCLRTEFADLWSLNGNIILTGAFLSSNVCLDLTSPETFAVNFWLLIARVGLGNAVKRKSPQDVHILGGTVVASSKKAWKHSSALFLAVTVYIVHLHVHDFDNAIIIQYLLAFYRSLSPGGTCVSRFPSPESKVCRLWLVPWWSWLKDGCHSLWIEMLQLFPRWALC